MHQHVSWWQWPTVLSIDAPVVAVLWQRLLAREAGLALGWPATVVLALSVWLAYMADRWIEGWRLETDRIRTPRHGFYKRFRWPVATLWIVAFAMDIAVAFARLNREDILAGLVLVAAVATYLLSHQLVHRHNQWRVPKELCVAGLLTAGVVIFLLRVPDPGVLTLPVSLFALLCFTNCALISVWERDVDLAHGQTSLALAPAGAGNERLIRQLPWMIAVLAAVSAMPDIGTAPDAAVAAAASAVLLALVDWLERRTGRQAARVLADIALMTPVVTLAASWLAR